VSAADVAAVGWGWLVAASLQAGVLALVVLAADRLLARFAWPRLRVALHLLVLFKLLVLPGVGPAVVPGTVAMPESIAQFARLAPSAPALPSFAGIALLAWGAVAATLLLGTAFRSRRARRRIERGATEAPARAASRVLSLAADLGLRRAPRLLESDAVAAPLVFGGRAACVVLPAGATASLSDRELEDVVLHELAHLKRHDPFCARFGAAVACLFWFHPLVWLVARRLAALRELACDATVAAHLGGDARRLASYRRTLLHAAARRFDEPLPAGAHGWSVAGSLFARLDWLARPRRVRPRRERLLTALVVAAIAGVVLPTAGAELGRAVAAATDFDPLRRLARATVEAAARGARPPGCLQLHWSVLALAADAASSDAPR